MGVGRRFGEDLLDTPVGEPPGGLIFFHHNADMEPDGDLRSFVSGTHP